jgi:glyoxylase-like metal-dependent hydrolase (beta-lactamase superfamily II)
MTLDGTNTYVLAEAGSSHAVVVDPGPDDPDHLDRIEAELAQYDQQAAVVLLTHGHADHSAGAPRLARQLGCPVRAVDPHHRLGDEGLADAARLTVAGLEIGVRATPGHTSDSVCLHVPADGVLLTGDTVLGRGTTVVAHPDGVLSDYLRSLGQLEMFAAEHPGLRLLPGHGPAGAPVADVVALYRAHRAERLAQVTDAVTAGAHSLDDVVASVYADVDRSLWPAARVSVRAQVEHLVHTGVLREDGEVLSVPGA